MTLFWCKACGRRREMPPGEWPTGWIVDFENELDACRTRCRDVLMRRKQRLEEERNG